MSQKQVLLQDEASNSSSRYVQKGANEDSFQQERAQKQQVQQSERVQDLSETKSLAERQTASRQLEDQSSTKLMKRSSNNDSQQSQRQKKPLSWQSGRIDANESQNNALQSSGFYSSLFTNENFVSASTLRHSTASISFSKADRFPQIKSSNQGSIKYDLPRQLSNKSTSFGFGEKRIIPAHVINNAKQNPSPTKYSTHLEAGSTTVSRTFGIPYKYFAKTYIPQNPLKEPEASLDIPGVGTYAVASTPGNNTLKYSLQGKGRSYLDLYPSTTPPCNQYSPVERLVTPSRFSHTSFGFGKKFDFTSQSKFTPGPGTYILPSAFDKFKSERKIVREHRSFGTPLG